MIKLFVFDLGNVILPFDNHPIAERIVARSAGRRSPEEVFHYLFDLHLGAINHYEEGLCSSREFFEGLKDRYGLLCDFEEFKDLWNDIFREDHEVIRIITDLKAKGFPLFLLSNTNELHFEYILDTYPIVRLMDQWILSYKVGAKKPKKAMFDAIFERADVQGSEVFYVDDVEEYVEQARRMGITGHVFKDAEGLSRAIEAVL
jgi:glucose-1-phosphatase